VALFAKDYLLNAIANSSEYAIKKNEFMQKDGQAEEEI